MKIYISADMEGVAGITNWDEASRSHADYKYFVEQMTAEVNAACEGALEAGAKEIWVQDAHSSGRNLIHSALPKGVKLVRGWSGHPNLMVQELNDSFDALCMVGYHAPAGSDANTLAHTMSGRPAEVWLNGSTCSEFLLHGTLSATMGVPTVFVSGDAGLAAHVAEHNPHITAVTTSFAHGDSTVGEHPTIVQEKIRSGVQRALNGPIADCLLKTSPRYDLEIEFRTYHPTYKASFFPGVERVSERRIRFSTHSFFEVMRVFLFCV